MLAKGEIILVRDTGRLDTYRAQVEREQPDERHPNPLVRVLQILNYPIQHAIMDAGIPNENAPLFSGELARLEFMRRCDGGEYTRLPYDDTLHAALEAAISSAPTEAERAILLRHREGKYRKRRVEIRR